MRAFGLVVNPSLTWLGASPDGIVEVKCPFTRHFNTVEEAYSDPSFFATIMNDKVILKQEHKLH